MPTEYPDFDRVIDRGGGDATKWNKYAGRDVLPLWVADMDFAAPPAVLAALHKRVDHGVFGYGQPWPSLVAAVQEHLETEYAWRIDPDWLVWLPGLVTGLNVACRAVAGPVFTATPVYPPFLSAPGLAGRQLATAPLAGGAAGWTWDFAATARALKDAGSRLWLLCHPHNPVGRAWREEELEQIAALAEKHNLVVCSDEIHCGLVLDHDRRHRPFASLSAQAARSSITLMAPSKTFNVPGLGCAFAVIPEPRLRRDFRSAMNGIVPHVNTLGLVACEAALREGGPWRRALIDYLRANRNRVGAAVAAMPGLAMAPVEATYLAWIDTAGAGLAQPQRFFEQAGVGLSDGADFGRDDRYRSFVRLNFGCPRATLDRALERMARSLAGLSSTNIPVWEPAMDDSADRRRFWRASFRSPVLLVGKAGGVDAELVDISLKGALLKVPPAWPGRIDDGCQLKLKLTEGNSIVMHGRIAHVQGRRVGIHCESIDVDSITHLRRLVELNAGDAELLERELAALIGAE